MPIRVDEYKAMYAYKRMTPLFKTEKANYTPALCKGISIIKNGKLNPFRDAALKLVDTASSIIKSHPKFGKNLLALSEKILRNADVLQ